VAIKSCGYCDIPEIGDIFNKLTIIDVKYGRTKGCTVKCKCGCGKYVEWLQFGFVKNGHNKSCGNCELLRNGVSTSHMALELHQVIEKLLNKKCEHNKYINRRCFDIVCAELKIVIEYDGYYYHRIKRNTIKQEKNDEKILKNEGYKFLRIRSDGCDIPTEKQLRKVLLNDFQHGVSKRTITMKSWKIKENTN
jgi:very-short-patch-repair endonuclease